MTTRRTTKANPKAPARAATSARSATKSARGRAKRRTYTAEDKAGALEQLAGEGMAATHKATGIPKATLARWAKAAGVELDEQARARTRSAAEAVKARAAEARLSTVELLEQHITEAGDYLATVTGVNALAARLIAQLPPDKITRAVGMAGPYAVVEDQAAEDVANVALALAGLPLATRDAEGILTRAIHDLQLLRGEATERGELVVEFAVPRPKPPADTDVVEYPTDPEE